MNVGTVKTLFRTELRMVLRDRRVLLASIILPMLVTPFLFLASHWTVKRREQTLRNMVYRYAVSGSQAAQVHALLAATRERLESAVTTRSNSAHFRFEEVTCEDAYLALAKGEIQLLVQGLTADEARQAAPKAESHPAAAGRATRKRAANTADIEDDDETPMKGAPVVRLVYRADRDDSLSGMSRLHDELWRTRELERTALLSERGFPVARTNVAAVSEHDLASGAQVAGLTLGRFASALVLLFILMAGAVVATDSLAGEKERGTLETLLTTAAGRIEILAAKHLVILAVALFITVMEIANFLAYVALKLVPVPPNFTAALTPGVALLLFVLFLPVGALAANCLLLLSGYARSYKEAQMYFLPALLLGLLPGLAPLLPGIELRSILVLVPVANIALGVKEVMLGRFDWPVLIVSWFVTAAATAWTMRWGVRLLSAERLITAGETDAVSFSGGPALFERQVPGWFAVLWALLLLVNNYFEKTDLRLQIVVNLVGLMFGTGCLLIRHYRLKPREALALRMPRPAVWVGVLAAAPGGLLTALGLFRLSSSFLPVPTKTLESFNQSVLPAGIPTAQLLFFLTVMPAVFEEFTFRGLLLYGLRRRLRPVALALVVGVVFGLFHVALFRFVPTASLGVMLAAVTMLTGSIFPAMLWHCLNNAAGILAYKLQIPETELGTVCYLTGAGILAAAFWIFWRNRTPYPGLRGAGR